MEKASVFYSPLKNKATVSPLNKIKKLINRCGAKDIYEKDTLVAVKVHFGELGNTAFLRPIFLRPVLEVLSGFGAKPFLTDTNTLYAGMRNNSVNHLHNANLNGFNYATLQVPVIIADGLRGENNVEVPVPNGELLKTAILASDIINADALFVMSHFKGHEHTGFGGAIKNLSMGCAARAGKLVMHSSSKPYVIEKKCTACGRCKQACLVGAIKISGTASIMEEICTGCARCISVCPEQAIAPRWNNGSETLQKLMAEYAAAVVSSFNKPIVFVNILTSMSPACDCMPGNDAPVMHDLGYIASTDPVAVDKASMDLVKYHSGGEDPFFKINGTSGDAQLNHAAKIGMGSLDYEIKTS